MTRSIKASEKANAAHVDAPGYVDPVGVNDATLHYLDVIYRLTLAGEAANTTDAS